MFEIFHPTPLTSIWDRALLGPVAEFNQQLLEGLCLAAIAATPTAGATSEVASEGGALTGARPPPANSHGAPRLVVVLREAWCGLDQRSLQRLSGCPYLLIDAGFARPERWGPSPVGVRDAGQRGGYFSDRAAVALIRRTLVFGWHLARCNRAAARLVLGMSAATAERIAARGLNELEAVAESSPSWIVPRWEQQPNVWRQLIAAACQDNPVQLREAQLRGLQLLAGAAGGRGPGGS